MRGVYDGVLPMFSDYELRDIGGKLSLTISADLFISPLRIYIAKKRIKKYLDVGVQHKVFIYESV